MSDSTGHRLPLSITPSAYRLHIDTDLAGSRFTGSVDIDIAVTEPTSSIVCNASNLEIAGARLSVDGTQTALNVRLDAERELLIVDLDAPLAAGSEATVHFEFAGELNDQLVGYYRSEYSVDGVAGALAVTQFEAPYARWAFPCWDEPAFKATFEISLTCDADLLAVSNGAETARVQLSDGRTRFDFAPTMIMSTYLVAWVVGDLEASRTVTGSDTEIRVLHRRGHGDMCDFALDCAAHAVEWFEQYYDLAYPSDKLDLIAVPDFAFGAMENLGCVTFRETLLLIDPQRASRTELERAATVIEHEIAHMWFGDLVTMQWWDGIWLNEAFATFMEISCADAYRPEWNIWTSFSMSRSQAFDTDGLANTRAIEFEVLTPADAEAMFDILTYEKGAAVLRMFEQWAGPENFRNGVRTYLRRHAYSNTETADLWTALSEHCGVDVVAMMNSWILQGGHPIVSAALDGTALSLTQERFGFVGGDPAEDRSWVVPLRIRSSAGGVCTERTVLLEHNSTTVDLEVEADWVTINADSTGFYRSRYSGELSARLLAALDSLSTIERHALLDDTWALFLAGAVDLDAVTSTLRAIAATETDPSVWRLIASVLSQLRTLAPINRRDGVRTLAAEIVGPHLDVLDADDLDADAKDRRAVIARLAGTVADLDDVIAFANTAFVTSVGPGATTPSALDADLESAILDIVATHADANTYDQIVQLTQSADTPQEELRALNALARVRDGELMARFCEWCATSVRTQNAPYVLASAMGNPAVGEQVWEFVAANWDRLLDRFPSSSIDRMAGGVRGFADSELVARIGAFFDEHPRPQSALVLAQHLERTRVNVAARQRLSDQLG